MKNTDLLRYIGDVDDRYILAAHRKARKKNRLPLIMSAAALLAIVVVGGGLGIYSLSSGAVKNSAGAEAAVVESAQEGFGNIDEGSEALAAASDGAYNSGGENRGNVNLLASATLPEAIAWEDYESASANWKENQVSEETAYALSSFSYRSAAALLGAGGSENECYCPYSLYIALSILADGAAGDTQNELLSLLGMEDIDLLREEAGKLYRVNYKDNEGGKLLPACSLWLDSVSNDGMPITYHQDWVMNTAASYYADVYDADFSSPDTTDALGSWIAEKTGGNLAPDANALGVTEDTVMEIINTVWYKASWAEPFDAEDTASGEFYRSDGSPSSVDFMHACLSGGYVRGSDYTKASLYLSYGNIIFILPDEGTSVDDLLKEDRLWDCFESSDYTYTDINWSVPEFSYDSNYNLASALNALGITSAFDENSADFSGISDTPLYLTTAYQGTHIALDETGIEAAAYTSLGMEAATSIGDITEPLEMNLNRPFLYLITTDDGSPLMIGVVRDPSAD